MQPWCLSIIKAGIKPTKVVVLEIADEVLEERVLGRRTDPDTGIVSTVLSG